MGGLQCKGKRPQVFNETGFTLIELMISLSIIVLVMAIAIPNFQAAAEKAQSAGCASNQKIILGHIENYFMENKEYPLTTFTILRESNMDQQGDLIDKDNHFDIEEKIVGNAENSSGNSVEYFHRAYHALENNDGWQPLNMKELKESGYFREIVKCPRGGIYLVEISENDRVKNIMCSVQGSMIE